MWDRRRTRRLFGFGHALEAYKPPAEREHGYFAMPLLARGRLRGGVDPKRKGGTLVAQHSVESLTALTDLARALREAATWVGCDAVHVERVEPVSLAAPLAQALA